MVIEVALRALTKVNWVMAGICQNCAPAVTSPRHRLRAAALKRQVHWMVGKSTCGNGATGKNGIATSPTKPIAAISSDVAIGRSING
jgi:hypothetical protein